MSALPLFRVTALLEAPEGADPDAARTAWTKDDPFARLNDQGVTRYVRALAVATELRGFKPRNRLGAAQFLLSDEGAANALAASLNQREDLARTTLAGAEVSAVAFVGHTIIGPEDEIAPGLKAIYFVKRREGMTASKFHTYWRTIHGPMVIGQDGVTRYMQGHRLLSSYDADGTEYDGVTEMSYPDEAAIVAFGQCQPHTALQIEDAPKVFDMNVGKRVLTREQRIF